MARDRPSSYVNRIDGEPVSVLAPRRIAPGCLFLLIIFSKPDIVFGKPFRCIGLDFSLTNRDKDVPPTGMHRGPSVVCDRLITNGSRAGALALQRGGGLARGTLARDRPSPYDEGEAASTPVARGPVPRDRWNARGMARDRPSPYGNTRGVFLS